MERRRDDSREGRFERMKSDVVARLRHVCAHMSQSEFDDLVEQIVLVKIKYTFRRADDLFSDGTQRWTKDPEPPSSE